MASIAAAGRGGRRADLPLFGVEPARTAFFDALLAPIATLYRGHGRTHTAAVELRVRFGDVAHDDVTMQRNAGSPALRRGTVPA